MQIYPKQLAIQHVGRIRWGFRLGNGCTGDLDNRPVFLRMTRIGKSWLLWIRLWLLWGHVGQVDF
jgi:hypothetical protein